MANKKSASKKLSTREIILIVVIAVLIIALLVVLFGGDGLRSMLGAGQENEPPVKGNSVLSGSADYNLPPELNGKILEVHFINIGQGDAMVCMLPDGKILLIDAGSGTYNYARVPAEIRNNYNSYLEDNLKVDKIEYMIISHPDADHVNLAAEVLDNYVVENIYYNVYDGGTQTYTHFMTTARSEVGANLYEVTTEEVWTVTGENYSFTIYASGNTGFTGAASATNSMSIMCLLEYGGRKVLFTGDAEVETEEWFIEKIGDELCDIDVLKVGHHGSESCTSTDFVNFVKPEYAVISCGVGNSYRHPHAPTMQTLFNIGAITYRTDRHGDIVLYIDEDGDFGFLPENNVPVDNNSKGLNARTIIKD